jgi:hypothetical protein
MENISTNDMLQKLEEVIAKTENKDFNVYFFVIDTKNAPDGSVEYIYDIALNLLNKGYKVTMLHQEEEFIGPVEWLGERYAVLEHKNVEKDNVPISTTDFLFIPESCVSVMTQTKNLRCKKVMLYHTPEYFLKLMPMGATLTDLGIHDVIATSSQLADKVKRYFPNIKVNVVRPSVKNCFYTTDTPKKLIVNIMGSEESDINNILKPFFWKYPAYKWVSFRDMHGMTQNVYADVLREGVITVWVDDKTVNGQIALESLKCGNILIAKVPAMVPEWMVENGELREDIIWFETYDELHNILASVIRGWTRNDIVERFTDVHMKLKNVYTPEAQDKDIDNVIVDTIIRDRLNEYRQMLSGIKSKNVEA